MLSKISSVSKTIGERYCLFRDTLFYRRYPTSETWLVCVPLHRVDELITNFHEHFGHDGPKKCIAALRDVCFFRGLSRNVRRVVKSCDICQRAKYSTVRIEGKMQHIMVDASRMCRSIQTSATRVESRTIYVYSWC